MANISDGFRDIFLAGVGALSIGGEKAKETLDELVQRGQISVDEGKKINEELKHKAQSATAPLRDDTIRAYVKSLTKEERAAFAERVSNIVEEANAKDAKEDVVDVEAEVIEPDAAEN